MKKIGLREKFLIPTLFLILLGLSITSYVSYRNARSMMVDTVNHQLRQNTESILDFIVSWAENRRQDVMLWSAQNSVVQAISMAGQDADGLSGSFIFVREVNEDLRKYAQAHPDYAEIGIAGVSGSVLTTSRIDMSTDWSQRAEGSIDEHRNIRPTDYFQEALDGSEFVSSVRLDSETGMPFFAIASPVGQMTDRERQNIVGILYALVDMQFFARQFVEPISIGRQGYLYIVDREGTVIAHPDQARILTENIAHTQIGEIILAQQEGLAGYAADGSEWLAAFKTDESLGWTVVAVADMAEHMAPVKNLALFSAVLTLVILVIAVVVIIVVASRLSKPINAITEALYQVAGQVSGAADQISGSSQQLAQGAAVQASSIEETSASLEQLASMAHDNADNAQQASTLSKEATDAADSGVGAMDTLLSSMEGISASSSEVATVAKGIEEIAFQTNLLALNAAVEAARAGEAGRGFAVVADEVRNLAQRASEQARITSTLITESGNRTREGSQQAAEANDVLKVIQERVAKVVGLVSEISAASREQAQGIGQINKAVSSMEQVVQQNSASSEQSASASEQLSSQAVHMKQLVSSLSERVAGSAVDMVGEGNDIKQHSLRLGTADPAKKTAPAVNLPAAEDNPRPDGPKAEDLIPFDEEDEQRDF